MTAAAAEAAVTAVAAGDGAPSAFTLRDSRIVESSGLAASRAHPGVYWTHNDSGYTPNIYAVDSDTGRTLATITLDGTAGRDLEAVSLGPDGRLYIGDIGDNLGGTWPEVWIYRFPEPEQLQDATLTPEIFTVRYQDGPRDAEALMVHPDTGRVYIASKSDEGEGGLYRGPAELVPAATGSNTFRRIADLDLWVTDGAFSPDGSRLALRGYFTGAVYAWPGDGEGEPKKLGALQVPLQRQGESMTFAPDGRTLMLGTEGAGSRVEPVELSAAQLPESAGQAQESASGDSPDGTGAARQDSGPAADDDARTGVLTGGGLTLAVLLAVLLLGRRLVGKRRD